MKTNPHTTKNQKSHTSRASRRANPSRTSNKHRPISRLADLTPAQLDQLAAWHHDGLSIQDCATRATAEFSRPIPKTSVQRFLEHRRSAELLGDAPAALEAASEINQYAATGRAEFSDASLFLLEKQAFDLVRRRAPGDDLDELTGLFLLIHKARNTAVRERHAAVQETKAKLRQREFDWKKKLIQDKEDKYFKDGEQEEAVFQLFGELPEPDCSALANLADEFNPDGSFKAKSEDNNTGENPNHTTHENANLSENDQSSIINHQSPRSCAPSSPSAPSAVSPPAQSLPLHTGVAPASASPGCAAPHPVLSVAHPPAPQI